MSIRFVTREYPEFPGLVCEGIYAEAEATALSWLLARHEQP